MRKLKPTTIHPALRQLRPQHRSPTGRPHSLLLGATRHRTETAPSPKASRKNRRAYVSAPSRQLSREAGRFGLSDLVRLNAYVSAAEHLGGYMRVRDEFVGSPLPASTLMVVSGFARPAFKVEIEAIAARAGDAGEAR